MDFEKVAQIVLAVATLGLSMERVKQMMASRNDKRRSVAGTRREEAEARKAELEADLTASELLERLERRVNNLARRQERYEQHIDDLYITIRTEGQDAAKRMISRLTTKRPNGEPVE